MTNKKITYPSTIKQLKTALIFFIIVAVFGTLLRYYFFSPFPGFNVTYVIHAHSHLAFLGWVFLALFALINHRFLSTALKEHRKYQFLFWIFTLSNIGMGVTFPFTGYAFWSILFSAVHSVASIVYAVFFIRDTRMDLRHYENPCPLRLIHWGLIFMAFSNLGPFALGPIMANGLGKSDLYYMVIYFYLHFQYNGWFTLAVLGLLLLLLERKGIPLHTRWFTRLMIYTVVPAYVLSGLWLEPGAFWYWLGGITGLVQLWACILLFVQLLKQRKALKEALPGYFYSMLLPALAAFGVKNLLQLSSALPSLGTMAFTNRDLVIAYLHLVLLGFITLLILYLMHKFNFLAAGKRLNYALGMFMAGFYLSEVILVTRPFLNFPGHHLGLLVLAFCQLTGVILLIGQVRKAVSVPTEKEMAL